MIPGGESLAELQGVTSSGYHDYITVELLEVASVRENIECFIHTGKKYVVMIWDETAIYDSSIITSDGIETEPIDSIWTLIDRYGYGFAISLWASHGYAYGITKIYVP